MIVTAFYLMKQQLSMMAVPLAEDQNMALLPHSARLHHRTKM